MSLNQHNGCGSAKGMWAWVKPPQGHARVHCDAHDEAYDIGGDEHDRYLADRALMRGIMGDATGRPWWQRPGFRVKAILYYLAVRKFASPYFYYHAKEAP